VTDAESTPITGIGELAANDADDGKYATQHPLECAGCQIHDRSAVGRTRLRPGGRARTEIVWDIGF
jgi:hypothetical protein